MKKLRFKTNIKCMGCIAAVTPNLNQAEGVLNWEVDLQHPDKLLTVEVADAADGAASVQKALQAAGYRSEPEN